MGLGFAVLISTVSGSTAVIEEMNLVRLDAEGPFALPSSVCSHFQALTTASAVNFSPLWKVTLGRSLKRHVVASTFSQLTASAGFGAPSVSTKVSVSNIGVHEKTLGVPMPL